MASDIESSLEQVTTQIDGRLSAEVLSCEPPKDKIVLKSKHQYPEDFKRGLAEWYVRTNGKKPGVLVKLQHHIVSNGAKKYVTSRSLFLTSPFVPNTLYGSDRVFGADVEKIVDVGFFGLDFILGHEVVHSRFGSQYMEQVNPSYSKINLKL